MTNNNTGTLTTTSGSGCIQVGGSNNQYTATTGYAYTSEKHRIINQLKNFLILNKEKLTFSQFNIEKDYIDTKQLVEFLDTL